MNELLQEVTKDIQNLEAFLQENKSDISKNSLLVLSEIKNKIEIIKNKVE